MSLESLINTDIKKAMLAKDSKSLEALRAIKAALLLAKTGKDAKDGVLSESNEIAILQKLVKQGKESADIYLKQDRKELAEDELFQVNIIQKYLPEQLSKEELTEIIEDIIKETGAASMKDMGKVMAMASQKLSGKAESRLIAQIVKQQLGVG